MLIFTDPDPQTPKEYGLYTHENVDIYGWPLADSTFTYIKTYMTKLWVETKQQN